MPSACLRNMPSRRCRSKPSGRHASATTARAPTRPGMNWTCKPSARNWRVRPRRAARYRAVRDQIARLVPIFDHPYYDPASGYGPDVARYEADTYVVESTRLSEKFTAYNELSNAWDKRANIFIVHLTLLAVTLSLYGLSTTLRGFMRSVFVGLGSIIAAIVTLWALIVMLLPIPSIAEDAIDAYANGVGKAWYGDTDGAIADFDRALRMLPDYANALYERGNAYYDKGDTPSALTNYQAALKAGRTDTSVGWNLGWTYYMVGRFDEAIDMDRRVLKQDPSLLGVQFNLALALMVRGDFAEAEQEYYKGVNGAVAEVTRAHEQGLEPPSSFWYYMDASAQDIDNLLLELDGNAKPWSQVPSRGTITADQSQLRSLASNMFHLLKDTTTALEFTGAAPNPNVTFTTGAFQFAQEEYDQDGNFVQYNIAYRFPSGTNSMVILFDYSGAVPGQSEIWKVYRNGYEDPTLRVIGTWALQESGKGSKSHQLRLQHPVRLCLRRIHRGTVHRLTPRPTRDVHRGMRSPRSSMHDRHGKHSRHPH